MSCLRVPETCADVFGLLQSSDSSALSEDIRIERWTKKYPRSANAATQAA